MNPVVVSAFVAVALLLLALAAALTFGGPARIAPLTSINQAFAAVDFSAVPPARSYAARDGTSLAWLDYPAPGAARDTPRIVLVHGSSSRARSLHPLAQALMAAGFDVAALDMRGHGDSGPRGQSAYVGQLEDDVEDFMRAVPHAGPSTLLGFSSGGGFVLRFAGSTRQGLFDRYLLLAPYLRYDAPTARRDHGGWVSVGFPRLFALRVLNAVGLTAWNHLPVLNFGLDDQSRPHLTPTYAYTLANSFGPHDDYLADIRGVRTALRVVVGSDDEIFRAEQFAVVFAAAGRPLPVTLVPGVNHMGVVLDPRAWSAIIDACRA
ncbi:MAG: alpha/beta fold hydrolase [Polaromonas sp.]|nr:alpha/beta fold hydrolase [Polaromonas sp.]